MFSIPNTPISFQTYDNDVGRVPAAQTFYASQPITGGYIFCSTSPVFVRLTVGINTPRVLPEFFLPPGVQGVEVDSRTGGQPVTRIEVRAAVATAAQFWGALATEHDPIGGFNPASYSIDSTGAVIPPPNIGLSFQQDGVNKSFRSIADFTSLGGVAWNISDDVPGTRAIIPVPKIGFQHNDGGQINEVIADFEDATLGSAAAPTLGNVFTLTDDAANNRVKISAVPQALITRDQITASTGTITPTTEATAVSVITTTSKTYVSQLVKVEFFTPSVFTSALPAAGNELTLVLKRDATVIVGKWAVINGPANIETRLPVKLEFYDTPAAGAHTYTLAAFAQAAAVWVINAGAGGTGALAPAFLRTSYDF